MLREGPKKKEKGKKKKKKEKEKEEIVRLILFTELFQKPVSNFNILADFFHIVPRGRNGDFCVFQ